jgi:DNA-binding Xre family transcriptional regulator
MNSFGLKKEVIQIYKLLLELPTLIFNISVTLCFRQNTMKDKDKKRLKKFSAHFAKVMDKNKIGVRDLSTRCDVDYGKISKIRNGKANLTLTTLIELAEGLDVRPKDLLDQDFD